MSSASTMARRLIATHIRRVFLVCTYTVHTNKCSFDPILMKKKGLNHSVHFSHSPLPADEHTVRNTHGAVRALEKGYAYYLSMLSNFGPSSQEKQLKKLLLLGVHLGVGWGGVFAPLP